MKNLTAEEKRKLIEQAHKLLDEVEEHLDFIFSSLREREEYQQAA